MHDQPEPRPPPLIEVLDLDALLLAWRRLGAPPLTPRDPRITALRELRRQLVAGRCPSGDELRALDGQRPARPMSMADRVVQRALLEVVQPRLDALDGKAGGPPLPAIRALLRGLEPAPSWTLLTIDLPGAIDHVRHEPVLEVVPTLGDDPLWQVIAAQHIRTCSHVPGRGLAENGPLSPVFLQAALRMHLDPCLDAIVAGRIGGARGWARSGPRSARAAGADAIAILCEGDADIAGILAELAAPLDRLGLAWLPRRTPLDTRTPRPALGRQLRLINAGTGLLPSDIGSG